ncbi:hypothetical protein F2Q68_00025143 [Brassica cretica]|uniref:Uncharacterized protein n=1 Tax=Brassica cretica TaxID=69181 RepID=A0A8S9IJF5_BRACR|nr:hypothetical protein F2Q68_00025143 [Brassica cretica]
MDNMFTELNSKYDAGTLSGKTDKNPKDYNAVELRSGRHLSDPVPKKLTAQEKGKQKEGEPPSLEDVHDDDHEPKQPPTAEPVAPMTQDQPVPTRVYIPKVPYPVPAKKSRKDCEEMKCKKMLEELNIKFSLMDAIQMIPLMRSLNAALSPKQGMIEEILADDPLEVALIRVESEQNTCNVDADGYEKMLDSCEIIEKLLEEKKREKYDLESFAQNSQLEQPECMFQRQR